MSKYRVSVHPAGMFGLLAACFFVPVDRLFSAGLAVVLHESGHVIAMRLCGVERCCIEWTPVGFVAQMEGLYLLSAAKRFWIAAGGIAASLFGCLVCLVFAGKSFFFYQMLTFNLSLCVFNGLPALPLDGSKMILAIATKAGVERIVEKLLLAVSYVVSAALSIIGLYSALAGFFNPLLLLTGPYLAYAAKASTRDSTIGMVQRSEMRRYRPGDGLYPACAYVATGEPDRSSLLRVLRECPENAYLLIHRVDAHTGKVSGVVSEKQFLQEIFEEHEMINKPHGHGKTDVLQ